MQSTEGTTVKEEEAGNIKIEVQTIERKKEAKYLGVILDEKSNFSKQLEEKRIKARQLHGGLSATQPKK